MGRRKVKRLAFVPIANALLNTGKRRINVEVILGKSQLKGNYLPGDFPPRVPGGATGSLNEVAYRQGIIHQERSSWRW